MIVKHRGEAVVIGFNFSAQLGPDDTLTDVVDIRLRREVDGVWLDVTDQIIRTLDGGEPDAWISEDTKRRVDVWTVKVEDEDTTQAAGTYLARVRARSSRGETIICMVGGKKEPELVITDGR